MKKLTFYLMDYFTFKIFPSKPRQISKPISRIASNVVDDCIYLVIFLNKKFDLIPYRSSKILF